MTTHTKQLARRSFLAGIGAVGAAVAIPTAAANAFQGDGSGHTCTDKCETMTVWRLDADWGYARGPHGKTKLESKASLNAAKNRWALTEQDALDMNLHKCSWAPAVPVEVNTCAFMEVWEHNGAGAYDWQNPWNGTLPRIFDERCLPHIDDTGQLWKRALDTRCQKTASPSFGGAILPTPADAVVDSASTGTTGTVGIAETAATADTASSGAVLGGDVPDLLAYTGASAMKPVTAATGMMAVGGVLAIVARRRAKVAEAEADVSTS